EAESEVGPSAIGQGLSLHAPPALARRRVRQIDDERKDAAAVEAAFLSAVELLDGYPVAVHRHDIVRMLRGDAGEGAGVASEIPDQVPTAAAGDFLHEGAFCFEVF